MGQKVIHELYASSCCFFCWVGLLTWDLIKSRWNCGVNSPCIIQKCTKNVLNSCLHMFVKKVECSSVVYWAFCPYTGTVHASGACCRGKGGDAWTLLMPWVHNQAWGFPHVFCHIANCCWVLCTCCPASQWWLSTCNVKQGVLEKYFIPMSLQAKVKVSGPVVWRHIVMYVFKWDIAIFC